MNERHEMNNDIEYIKIKNNETLKGITLLQYDLTKISSNFKFKN